MLTPVEARIDDTTPTGTALLCSVDPADAEDYDSFTEERSLIFRAAGRVYACGVAEVREVLRLPSIARLPGAPASVVGLVNVRGRIVTVFDGGVLLHGAPVTRADAMLLVVDSGERGVGMLVDRVADVRVVRAEEQYQRIDVRAAVARTVSINRASGGEQ